MIFFHREKENNRTVVQIKNNGENKDTWCFYHSNVEWKNKIEIQELSDETVLFNGIKTSSPLLKIIQKQSLVKEHL